MNWTASTGTGLTGYNVYRSADGTAYSKINASVVAATTYDNTIASPVGDGVFYYYKVTAVGGSESGYSNIVSTMHGSRLLNNYSSGCTFVTIHSPYVLDGGQTSVVDGGDFLIGASTSLYVLPGATFDLNATTLLTVNGLLRVVGTSTNPATITSHGLTTDSSGLGILLYGATNYDPTTGAGTLFQYASVNNLSFYGVFVASCSVGFLDSKFNAHPSDGMSQFKFGYVGNGMVQHCSFTNMYPEIDTPVGDTTQFKMEFNQFQNSANSFVFSGVAAPIVPAQVVNNVFTGSKALKMTGVTGTDIPLGGNYWLGGIGSPPVPSVTKDGTTTANVDFSTALSSAPAGVGPTW